jgi:predicted N-acetyltransferase YhbS
MRIRPCTPADYAAIIAVQQRAATDAQGLPIVPMTVEELIQADRDRPTHVAFGRWVAEAGGEIIGWAEHDQTSYRFHPRRFWLDGYVDPAHQRAGVGGALYTHVMAALAPFDPLTVRNAVREDMLAGLAFLAARGWREQQRTWLSELDPAAFDPAPFAATAAAVEARGIVIRTLPELADDRDRDRKLYELVWEIRQDLPDLDAPTKEPYEEYRALRLHHRDLPPDAYFVAVDRNAFVGLLYHRVDASEPHVLQIAQLGVARAYRGRGVAVALKLRGNAYARERGYAVVRTGNESANHAIVHINERMGFVRSHAYLHLVKTLASEADAG